MIRMQIDKLERRRIEAGVTRAAIAGRAGIAVATRRRVFRGLPVRLSIAQRVASVLGGSVGDLIDLDEAVKAAVQAARAAAVADEQGVGVQNALATLVGGRGLERS